MKKLVLMTLFLLCFASTAWAFSYTTVMSAAADYGDVPVVDGLNDVNVQKNLNSFLKKQCDDLCKRAGGKAHLSYRILLNKPTFFSLILKAEGKKTLYKGLNIDVPGGEESRTKDFFYMHDSFNSLIGDKPFVLASDGILVAEAPDADFTGRIPYVEALSCLNIANAARIIPSYKLTKEGDGGSLHLKQGEVVALYLASNPSTGYDWILDPKSIVDGVVNMGSSFFLPINTKPMMTGVPGTTILVFSFKKSGSYKLVFEYKRPWINQAVEKVSYNFVAE